MSIMSSSSLVVEIESLENLEKLFEMTLRGKWEEVVKIYENNPSTHKVRITQTGGTALHAAVIQNEKEIVSKLVKVIMKEDREALGVQNDAGYTALHHAASVGSVGMCKCIAKDYPQLISVKTNRSKTPLYIAVLNGKKDAFSYLHSLCLSSESMASCYSYAKRDRDGTTILHAAIRREHFDLGYLIIHMYEDLVNSVNNKGLTPIHFLASHSSAFKSGSKLGLWKGLIYKCK
ncbi:hypothetical protein FEM48_ZijujUnG0016100 [Ziziphus jujuba var. spinosa]|uniref:Uncharacterized protein n=1 Tax=Ziziphus jujuba var. spinosa TaxID=714518 RepID=A0A978U9V4_ZIZJJ|nr:hypothetical protein FEM48_ZijujUnG0016100 [Ziziphus jujuba var. spinosa]